MTMNILEKLFGRGSKSPRSVAKGRLHLVLMHDRAAISPAIMDEMRREILKVLSRYMDIDESALEMNVERENNTVALIANVPIRRIYTEKID